MATDLDERPADSGSDDLNPAQAHYDREFGSIADNFGDTADGSAEDENIRKARAGEEGGFYNPGGDRGGDAASAAESAALGVGGLAAAEMLGSGFNPIDRGGGVFNSLGGFFFGSAFRKRATIGSTITGLIFGGGLFGLTILSGPAHLMQESQIFLKNSRHSNQTSETRSARLFRAARLRDVGETRVGRLGSRSYGKTVQALKDIGIEYNRTTVTGAVSSIKVDTTKLAKQFPELKGMTLDEQKAFIQKQTGIPADRLQSIRGTAEGRTFASSFNAKDTNLIRLVNTRQAKLVTDSALRTAFRSRVLSKYTNTSSMWHPFKKAINEKLNDRSLRVQAIEREKARQDRIKRNASAAADQAGDAVKSKISGFKAAAGGALLVTAAMCQMRDAADDIVTFNQAAIVTPAVIDAATIESGGDQLKSNNDVDLLSVGATLSSQVDKNGKGFESSAAYRATEDPTKAPSGDDLGPEYKQAFLPDNNASNIRDTLGGGAIGGLACSPGGQIVQTLGGVGLLISSIADGGLSAAAFGALKGAAATAGAFYMLKHIVVELGKSHDPIPQVLSGSLGGSVAAYGARAGQNAVDIASGGIALAGSQLSYYDAPYEEADKAQFASTSLSHRLFATSDYRSLTSRVLDSTSPSVTQNVNTVATSILSVHWASSLMGALFKPASADSQPYTWAMPRYGIPDSIANDPRYSDPYDNADRVAELLDGSSGGDYISRAKSCFGDIITKGSDGWEVVPDKMVNPASEDYLGAHCSDTSDENWQRMMLFVFDSRTMDAAACAELNDSHSCSNIGFSSDGTGSTATTPAVNSNDPALYQDSSQVACAPGTVDVGIQTGYHDKQPVNIHLCALPNMPSASSESIPGSQYYVTGAEGHALVNARVSGQYYNMVEAAAKDGVTLRAESSFRTMAHQQTLCAQNPKCSSGNYKKVAEPGTSNHQMGLAIDFAKADGTSAISKGDQWYVWLTTNAGTFGIKNYPVEDWHWSPTGN